MFACWAIISRQKESWRNLWKCIYVSSQMRHNANKTQKRFLSQLSKSQLPTNCCVAPLICCASFSFMQGFSRLLLGLRESLKLLDMFPPFQESSLQKQSKWTRFGEVYWLTNYEEEECLYYQKTYVDNKSVRYAMNGARKICVKA